ncbi:Uncharacterised protein [uncultured archaeon]|nr:Uncharacterised protein [uncultured archaeon]
MAISIRRLMEMSDEEIARTFDKSIGKCAYERCGRDVMSSEEHRVVPAGVYHEDCYFDDWGEMIEQHPICNPCRRGIGIVMVDENDLEVRVN